MDFIDILKQFSAQAVKKRDQLQTEEATKMALIMPFFSQVLGYDVFNPDEFVPEFTADVGIKKKEKVDYAININGQPTILIEAKKSTEPLDKHDSQLFRYFGTTTAKFAILTNGIVYKFYTDLKETNKMDLEPFFEIDLTNIKDSQVPELKRFCKSAFDPEKMFEAATSLSYSYGIKKRFAAQLKDPSDEFIRFIIADVYKGTKTQAIIEKFRPLIKSTLNTYINELLNEKISSALITNEEKENDEAAEIVQREQDEVQEEVVGKSGISTTEDEITAYYIVCAILAEAVDISRISYKDTTNYFAIIVDGMPSRWVCHLKLERSKKYIIFRDSAKKEVKHEIGTQYDIYKYKSQLLDALKLIVGQ